MPLQQKLMKLRALLLTTVTLLFVASCAHRAPPSSAPDPDVLREREMGFLAAFFARDADRLAEYFAPDAALHVAGMPAVEGREAIHRFYTNMFGFLSASSATPERVTVAASGDLAYSTGRVSNEFSGPDGPVAYGGRYLIIWHRPAGEWLVKIYSVSSDQPDQER